MTEVFVLTLFVFTERLALNIGNETAAGIKNDSDLVARFARKIFTANSFRKRDRVQVFVFCLLICLFELQYWKNGYKTIMAF